MLRDAAHEWVTNLGESAIAWVLTTRRNIGPRVSPEFIFA
jgi:hypothetical protein